GDEVVPDEGVVALLVAGGQAHVLVEQEGAARREGQPFLTVATDQLGVGGDRGGSSGQAQHRAGVPGVAHGPLEEVGDDLRAGVCIGDDVDLHVACPFGGARRVRASSSLVTAGGR